MRKAAKFLTGLLILSLLISCAGLAKKETLPPGTEEGAAAEPAKAPAEAPKVAAGAESPGAEVEGKGGDFGDGEVGNGDLGNGDLGDGEEYSDRGAMSIRGAASSEEGSTAWVESAAPTESKSAESLKARTERAPSTSGLKAGFADDNRQFNYFLQFLNQYGPEVPHLPIPIEERLLLRAADSEGKPLPNAAVEVYADGSKPLCRGLTYSDGGFLFFPAEHAPSKEYRVVVTYNQVRREMRFQREGRREVYVRFDQARPEVRAIPLDILFILDTTGSMGEEIERLKTTIELINLNLAALSSKPQVRFGMVLYRDRGDDYLTDVVPFTGDLDRFQTALSRVAADGGGDDPEDLQTALREAVKMSWNRNGIRLAFIITDAAPHLDYGQQYTYVDAVHDGRETGIKLFSVGTGGLDLAGEYVLRQISQYSAAKYIFLTYGETGESEGGEPGSVSHHTGANYQTDKLEAIIIRFAKEELANVLGQPLEGEEDYFQATRVETEEREETLDKLFTMAVSQLIDYSTFHLPPETSASVLPLSPASPELNLHAEYFTEQLALSFSRGAEVRKIFRILERQDLQKILDELELQLSGLADEKQAARVGALLGAQVLVIGNLYAKGRSYELFLKLLRVETGEVLSITKAVIDRKLGLEG
jgi:Mg-chelatase subunit ChlD